VVLNLYLEEKYKYGPKRYKYIQRLTTMEEIAKQSIKHFH